MGNRCALCGKPTDNHFLRFNIEESVNGTLNGGFQFKLCIFCFLNLLPAELVSATYMSFYRKSAGKETLAD